MRIPLAAVAALAGAAVLLIGCSTSAPTARTVDTTEVVTTRAASTTTPKTTPRTVPKTTPKTAPKTTTPSTKAAPRSSAPPVVVTVIVTVQATPTIAPSTAPVGPAASVPLDVATLAGSYFGHDRFLVVQPNGTMHLEERSFTFCSDDPAPPCDNVVDNEIHNGIQVDLKVVSGSGPTGNATVTTSTDPTIPVGSTIVLTKTPDEIAFTGGGPLDGQFFCTKNAIAGECGA